MAKRPSWSWVRRSLYFQRDENARDVLIKIVPEGCDLIDAKKDKDSTGDHKCGNKNHVEAFTDITKPIPAFCVTPNDKICNRIRCPISRFEIFKALADQQKRPSEKAPQSEEPNA